MTYNDFDGDSAGCANNDTQHTQAHDDVSAE